MLSLAPTLNPQPSIPNHRSQPCTPVLALRAAWHGLLPRRYRIGPDSMKVYYHAHNGTVL